MAAAADGGSIAAAAPVPHGLLLRDAADELARLAADGLDRRARDAGDRTTERMGGASRAVAAAARALRGQRRAAAADLHRTGDVVGRAAWRCRDGNSAAARP